MSLASLTVLFEPRDLRHPAIGVLEGALIGSLAVAGALLIDDEAQRGNGVLLCVVGALLAVEHLHLVGSSPFPLLGWLAGPMAAVAVAVVLVRFPGPRLSVRGHRWAVAAAIVLIVSRLTVTVPPGRLRLGWWPALPMPASVAEAGLTLGNAYLVIMLCWFMGLMIWRVRNSKGLSRHELAPVVFASLGATMAVTGHIVSVFNGQSQVGLAVLVVEQIGLLAVPAGFIFAALRMRVTRGAVGGLLLRVGTSSTPIQIQAALSSTLSDRSLTLFMWASEEGHWSTATGQQLDPPSVAGRLVVPVNAEGGTVLAAIVTDASVARHGQLIDASVAAVRLTLQNAAAIGMLRRSRTRLAEAELAVRRRLERDLHDGIQQRLLALGMSVDRIVHATADAYTKELAAIVAEQVQEAITELRDLARGILPAVLTQSGLTAAVESAAERLPLLVARSIPAKRWPMAVEATAYFVICEGLNNVIKHALTDSAEVEVTDNGRTLIVLVRDQGRGCAVAPRGSGLLGLRDRVTALGGILLVDSTEGVGTCLTVELPYA